MDYSSLIERRKEWAARERNTSTLVKETYRALPGRPKTGDTLWNLMRLTWVNHTKDGISHWRSLKVPALLDLFGGRVDDESSVERAIQGLKLPARVRAVASRDTGFTNLYPPYRNTLHKWCKENQTRVLRLLRQASTLGSADDGRVELGRLTDQLPRIPSPSGERNLPASNALTPLLACFDPQSRFPVLNGKDGVRKLLRKLRLANGTTADQVQGLLDFIDRNGFPDAFTLDSTIDEIKPPKAPPMPERSKLGSGGRVLKKRDEVEIRTVLKNREVAYIKRHDAILTAFCNRFLGYAVTEGKDPKCRYDALIENYVGKGNDLLLEVKPEPDTGSIRIAIGQLFDYRHRLGRPAGVDLALVTVRTPASVYLKLLESLRISVLWFTDEGCHRLHGTGLVAKALGISHR